MAPHLSRKESVFPKYISFQRQSKLPTEIHARKSAPNGKSIYTNFIALFDFRHFRQHACYDIDIRLPDQRLNKRYLGMWLNSIYSKRRGVFSTTTE